ncbi:hypothetical protein GCM10027174_28730 [Salinifilum aidingensis]
MSLMKKIVGLASSPQGRRAIRQAKKYAQDPKTRAKIDEAKNKLLKGNKPSR